MRYVAWITLRRIGEKAVLAQFGIIALVLVYLGLRLDGGMVADLLNPEAGGGAVIGLFLGIFIAFWGSIEMPREIARQEVHVYLSKPLSRWQYILGKFAGMAALAVVAQILLLGVFCACLLVRGHVPSGALFIGSFKTALFLLLLSALTVGVSSVLSEIAALVCILVVLAASLLMFALPVVAWSTFTPTVAYLTMAGYYLLPNLLHYRWPAPPGAAVPYLLWLTVYTFGWVGIILVLGHAVFRLRDLK